jgi:hypothetical protein
MNSPKASKRNTNSGTSFLVSEITANTNNPIVEYKLIEAESYAIAEVFNYLFEKVQKELEMT